MEPKRTIIANAFSINMLEGSGTVKFTKVDVEHVWKYFTYVAYGELECAIGHDDLAHLVSKELELNLKANRVSVTLGKDDMLIVAQYKGSRLPEGATELPSGATIDYYMVALV